MTDIFISYTQSDSAIARRVADALMQKGFSVWWDASLMPGDSFAEVILRRIDKAKKVIVLWSADSVRSEWVLSEAHRARDADKLIPIVLPGTTIQNLPIPFNILHSIIWTEESGIDQLGHALRPTGSYIGKSDPVAPDAHYTARGSTERVRVFIAHASSDEPRLSAPLTEIVKMGFRVWIDKPEELDVEPAIQKKIGLERVHYGQDWQSRISEAVKKSDCVLAFWSKDAIRGRSQQFYYELYMGLVQQKLIQCRIDAVPIDEIGMPYTFHHIADLSRFAPGKFSLPLDQLMEDLVNRRRRRLFGMLG
jgi:hypothetical protein